MIVGFKWSIVEYARKIEELFAKMEGVRSVVLPPNREVIDGYFGYVWRAVHTLTAAVLSQPSPSSSGSDDVKKFELHLEAEEARLGNNLRAVDYIIDGIDTIPLIAGVGRIEKVRLGMHISRISTHLCCRPSSRYCTCS
jgi:hypothetical protein